MFGRFFKKAWPFLAVTAVFLLSLLDWKNQNVSQQTAVTQVDFAMNTVVSYCFYGDGAEKALEECRSLLSELEHTLSAAWEGSDLLAIGEAAGEKAVKVSPETVLLLRRACLVTEETDGCFDVTISPLVQLWNITAVDPKIPSQQQIDALLPLVGIPPVIDEEAQTVYLTVKGQKLDFGGIAKGYACERLREICQTYDVTDGYVSLGGNMMVLGEMNGVFGIRDPNGNRDAYFAELSLAGKTMATSGGYERYFEQDGKRYHHILDPRTGWPAQTDLLSVSVISEDGALADALSTALFVMGREKALEYLEEHSEVQAVMLDDVGTVWTYGDIPGFSLRKDSGYRLETIEGKKE